MQNLLLPRVLCDLNREEIVTNNLCAASNEKQAIDSKHERLESGFRGCLE